MPAFRPSGFFVLRTPLLPLETLTRWSEGLEAPGALASGDDAALEAAVARDRETLRARLRAIVTTPEMREAIFLASPGLESRMDTWLTEPDSEKGRKMEATLVRYVSRAAARPTPFGLFAGHSVGTLGDETRLELPPRSEYRRKTRVDVRVLLRLAARIVGDARARESIRFVPNDTIARAGSTLRYVESIFSADGERGEHRLVSATSTPHLEMVLARAAGGATLPDLARSVVDGDIDVDHDEARRYVESLVDARLLLPMIAPILTTTDPGAAFAEAIELQDLETEADAVRRAIVTLDRIDARGVGAPPSIYRDAATALLGMPSTGAAFVQVNLLKTSRDVTFSSEAVASISRAAEILHRVGTEHRLQPLDAFRAAFADRFEMREVPLLEALDPDTGIDFDQREGGEEDTPLLDRIPLGTPEASEPWTRRHAWMIRRLGELTMRGATEWNLDDADIAALSTENVLPESFALAATLERDEHGSAVVHARWVAGPSSTRVFGRLCAVDARLADLTREALRHEAALHDDAVFAEVVHLPDGDTANGLVRPTLRDYEIPCLGRSGAPVNQQIPLDDLGLSLVGERFVLRSRKLGCIVVPRATTAHNARVADVPVYRFLVAIAAQDAAPHVSWDWGPLAAAPFLPRVRHGDVVLHPARWTLFADEIAAVAERRGASRMTWIRDVLRDARRFPRRVALAEEDHVFVVDLENVLAVDALVGAVRDRASVSLVEAPGESVVGERGTRDTFANEAIVPFVTEAPMVEFTAPPPRPTPVVRTFIEGSEWLSLRLYAGSASTLEMLRDLLPGLVGEARARAPIDDWFFLPAPRPNRHVRLRLRGRGIALHEDVLPSIRSAVDAWIVDGRLRGLEVNTYEREVERYGGARGIELAERFFTADSEMALSLVALDAPWPDVSWRATVAAHHALFDLVSLSLEERHALIAAMHARYAHEHRAAANVQHAIGRRYRESRAELEALLDTASGASTPLASIIHQRSAALAEWVSRLHDVERRGDLDLPVRVLARSYMHMSAARLLHVRLRAQELVIAGVMARLYESRIKRRATR